LPTTISTLDPKEIEDTFSHEVCRQIFDGLFEVDTDSTAMTGAPLPESRVQPSLVATWSCTDDRLTYRFQLRPDCRFHATFGPQEAPTANGGRMVVAEDVEFTFKRLLSPDFKSPRRKAFWVIKGAQAFSEGATQHLEGIRVISSDTVDITLERPFAPFLAMLSLSNAFIVPREDVEALKEGFAATPVGAGPFFWAGKQDQTIVLKPNRNYYRGRPYLDGIEFSAVKDELDRFQRFKKGELSVTDVPDPEYKNVKADPGLMPYCQEVSRWGTQYLGFNVTIPPFNDVRVRRAFNYAIDRETIVKLILNDRAKIAKGVLPPGILGYSRELEGYRFNQKKAAELLNAAGYPQGKGFPEITLQTNKDSMHSRICEFMLANLRDIGINCSIKEVEFKDHLVGIIAGQVPFFRLGWSVDYPDPDNMIYLLFHSANHGAEGNYSMYTNPTVDQLLDQGRFELDSRQRLAAYQKAEQIIVDDAPWVFVYHYTTHLLSQPTIRGLVLTPMGSPYINYRKIWFSRSVKTP
jgi:peptide/nickel transport system substrate-binding protein/oligopeptide transport system substrate-binding protein